MKQIRRILIGAAMAASLAAVAQMGGPGAGHGGPRYGPDVTPGWSMMTPEERKAHQEKMQGFKDAGQCRSYMTEHRKKMEERAKEKGSTLPGTGPGPACDMMK